MRTPTFLALFFLGAFGLSSAIPDEKPAEKEDASGKAEKNEALVEATLDGDAAKVLSLLESGAAVNAKDSNGRTALMYADRVKGVEVVKVLLKAGAEVKVKDNKGRTALMYQAYGGNDAIVEMLLKAGAEVNGKDEKDRTPLIWAATRDTRLRGELWRDTGEGREAVLKGALQDPTGDEVIYQTIGDVGDTPARALLKAGAKANAKDKDDRTALIWATRFGNISVVRALVEAGADVEAKDKNGRTALMIAEASLQKAREEIQKAKETRQKAAEKEEAEATTEETQKAIRGTEEDLRKTRFYAAHREEMNAGVLQEMAEDAAERLQEIVVLLTNARPSPLNAPGGSPQEQSQPQKKVPKQ